MIAFQPWVGSHFRQASIRVLLLGESHYGEHHGEASRSTIHVVEKWKAGEWAIRYLTTAARLLTGKEAWQVDRQNDLEAIAFYNFVQDGMETILHRPSWEQFQASHGAFRATLMQLDPTHVLATGVGLWNAMRRFDVGGQGDEADLAGKTRLVGRYTTPSGSALATMVPHLSRRFSASEWHKPVATFLSMEP